MKNKLIKIACVAIAAAAFAGSAYADPEPSASGLFLYDSSDPSASVSVGLTDDGAQYNGMVGNWDVVITSGAETAGGDNPAMNLSVNSAVNNGTGTLYIYFVSGLVGPSDGSVNFTFIDPPSLQSFALEGLTIPDLAPVVGNTIDSGGSQYYLGIEDEINGNITTSLESDLSVPDGGLTVGLLGLAFAGVETLRRKLVKA